MFRSRLKNSFFVSVFFITAAVSSGFSDDAFNKLIEAKNYSEALSYADKKIPTSDRDAGIWINLGVANLELGLAEKALACYLVASRMDAKSYNAQLGCAKVFNQLNQPANAAVAAKKALDLNFTKEASWEFAKACIAQNKPAEAKKALEKVVETDSANVPAIKELGNIYLSEKNYPKAIEMLKAVFAKQADGSLAMVIGAAYRETNQPESALVYLKLAKDKSQTRGEASFELAKIYFNTQQYDKACAEFDDISAKIPLGALDYWAWGFSLTKANAAPEKIVKAYQAALEKFGPAKSKEALGAHAAVAAYFMTQKNYQAAIGHFQTIFTSDSTGKLVPDINYSLALCNEGMDNAKRAIYFLERELILNPTNVGAYAKLGDLYEKEGLSDKARGIYEKMLSLNPNNPKIQMALGEYYLKAQKYQEALKYFQKSYTLDHTALAAQGMAVSASALDQSDMARDAAESALRLDANLWDPRVVLSKIYLKDKNYKDAKDQFEQMVKKQPANKDYWLQLATCYEQLSDDQHLAEIDKKILTIEPKNVASRTRLAHYTLAQGDTKAAFDQYKELSVISPKDPEIFKNLYELAQKNGNAADAALYLKSYVGFKPTDAAAQKNLGDILYDKKEAAGALAAYRAATKADPAIKGVYKRYSELLGDKADPAEIAAVQNGAIATGEADAQTYATLGTVYLKQAQCPKAIEMFEKAVQLDPKNVAVLTMLAQCQAKVGNAKEAIVSYEQVLTMNDKAVEEFKALGDLYVSQNKTSQAVGVYQKYLAKKPGDSRIAKIVALYNYEQKNYEEAIKYFALINEDDMDNSELLLKYATACYSVKDYKKAKALYIQLAALTPKSADVYNTLFDIASKDSTAKTEAIGYLQKYVALKPANAEAQKNLGDLLYETKSQLGALAAYNAAIAADPAIKGFYKRYVELVMLKGSPEALVNAMTGAIKAQEADAAMYSSLGAVYQKQGNNAKAIDMYQKALTADPKNTSALSSLAQCQAKSGAIGEAMVTYEQAIVMNDKAVDEYKALGELYSKQNKTAQAISVYKKYLAKKPTDSRIAKTVAEYESGQKNFDEAIKYYAMVGGEDAKNADLLFKYGQACYAVKDFKKAKEIFVQLALLSQKNADVFKTLFDITSKDNATKSEAAMYLQKYVTLNPDDAAAQKNLGDMLYDAKNQAGALNAYKAALDADSTLKGFYKRYVELVMLKGTSEDVVTALTGAIKANEADAAMYSSMGAVYQKKAAYPKAIEMYQNSMQLDPRNVTVLASLAQCQAKAGKVNEAVISYEQVVAMNSSAVEELRELGDLYGKQNKAAQAISMYKKYLEKKPGDFKTAKAVGDFAYEQKNYDEAIKYYAMITGPDTKNAEFLFKYGQACYFAKNYKKATEELNLLATVSPNNAEVQKMLYDISLKNGGTKTESITYLKRLVAAKPSDAQNQKQLGDMLYEAKDNDGALAAYKAALVADPAIKGFYKQYVEIVTKKGVQEEVVKAMKGAVAAGEADASMFEAIGKIEQKNGAFAKAIDYYQKALQLDPKNVSALSELAQCQAKAGNVSDAVLSYEQATAMNPNACEEFNTLGSLYMQQKKQSQAIAMYKKYLEKKPTAYKVALIVGNYVFDQKDYDASVKYFGMVGGDESRNADFLWKYAQACFFAKNNKKSVEVLLQLAKLTPTNADVFKMLYDIASKDNATQKDAAEYLRKFVALKPSDAAAQKNLGDILYDAKNNAGALAAYKAALVADPTLKGFYKRYVELVTAQGVAEETIKALKGAIAANEADAPMFVSLGDVYRKTDNYPKAIDMYTKALSLDSRNNGALSSLAFCQAKAGNLKDATITYEQVVAMDPKDVGEYKALAALYAKQNKNDLAMNMYKKCLAKKPDDYKTAMTVGEYELKNKNFDEAVKYFAMVQGAEAQSTAFLLEYGQACYQSKSCSKSFDIYKQLATLAPTNADVFKTLYDISAKANNNADKITYLKKYVALKPADAAAQKDLGDLLYDQKDQAGALIAYRAALKADPSLKGFYKRYVELVTTKGSQEEIGAALAGAAAAGEADAVMYASLGAIYQKSAQYDKAVIAYQKALNTDQRNLTVLSALALCQAKAGNVNDAVVSYEQATAMNPAAVDEYKALGDLYTKQGKASQALVMYKKYLEKNAKDMDVALSVGNVAFTAKKYDEAVKYLAMVQGASADAIDFLFVYGQASYYSKDYKKTIALFEKFREKNALLKSKNAGTQTVLKLLADAYDKSGNAEKALSTYTAYTKLPGVKDGDASFRRAQLIEAGNPDMAAKLYEANSVEYPKDYRNLLYAGLYFAKDEDSQDKALALMKKCAALADTIPSLWLAMGEVYSKLGKSREELESYNKFIQLDPQNADACTKFGETLLAKKKTDDALKFLEIANTLKNNDPKIMVLLTRGYIATNRPANALEYLEKADRLKPGDDTIKAMLFDLYKQTNQPQKALDAIKAIVEKNRNNKNLLKYAEALYLAGVYATAESTIKDITATEPENIDALMLFGKIQSIQGKWDDALETYKEISYINPNYAPAMFERAEVYMLQTKVQWAKTFYDRALKADPKMALAELGLAKVCKSLKDNDGYNTHFANAKKMDPNNKLILEEELKKK